MLVLRKREPGRTRVFRTPLPWIVGPVAILGCLYLFVSLPVKTQLWFGIWNAIGLVIYFAYARQKALLAKAVDV